MNNILSIFAVLLFHVFLFSCAQPDNSEFHELTRENGPTIQVSRTSESGFNCAADDCPEAIVMVTDKKNKSQVCSAVMIDQDKLLTSSDCFSKIAKSCTTNVSIKRADNKELGCKKIRVNNSVGTSKENSYGFTLIQTDSKVTKDQVMEFSDYSFDKSEAVNVWYFDYNKKSKDYDLKENRYCRMSFNNLLLPTLQDMSMKNVTIVNCPIENQSSGLVLDGSQRLSSLVWTSIKANRIFNHFMAKKGRNLNIANTVHCIQTQLSEVYSRSEFVNLNRYSENTLKGCTTSNTFQSLENRYGQIVYNSSSRDEDVVRFKAIINNKIRFFEAHYPSCLFNANVITFYESIPSVDRYFEIDSIETKKLKRDFFKVSRRSSFPGYEFTIRYKGKKLKSFKSRTCK